MSRSVRHHAWPWPIVIVTATAFMQSSLAFQQHQCCHHRRPFAVTTQLRMGLLDSLGSFLNKRDGDFVKLEESLDTFGPGPLILIYGCPDGVTDEELVDMISDGAPKASNASPAGVLCRRFDANSIDILDLTVEQALGKVVQEGQVNKAAEGAAAAAAAVQPPCPVIYFSGIGNDEMTTTYRIISSEIYEETGGAAKAACAKVVPPAMEKPLRQVIEEITGDHLDAIKPEEGLEEYGL